MLLTYSCSSLKNFSSKLQYPSLDLMYYCVYNAAIYWEYDEQKYNLPQEFVHCQVKPISQPLNDPHKQRLTATHMHTKPLLTLLLFSGLVWPAYFSKDYSQLCQSPICLPADFWGLMAQDCLQARCRYYHPINSVKALKSCIYKQCRMNL